jgi:hypothetical protein
VVKKLKKRMHVKIIFCKVLMSSCSTAFIVNYQTLADVSTSLTKAIDKLKLAGQNLDQVFNFRHGRAFAPRTSFIAAKLPNLKWKT